MSEVLVTGGAGFIGSHLSERLLEDGHSVKVIDNLSRGKIENVPENVEFIEGDIREEALVDGLVKASDSVFHLAALARVIPSIQNPRQYHETNVNGTFNLIESCRRYGKQIVYISTSSVFGNQDAKNSEKIAKEPLNPYGLQKLIGEYYLKLYGKLYDLDYSILRYYSVYGERQLTEGAYALVIGIFQRQAAEGKPLTIVGDGSQRRDFTYVKDAVDATVRCLDNPNAYQQEFNIGRGANASVKEIADLISPNQVFIPERQGEMFETLCDNTKARKLLGWHPNMSVKTWLNEYQDIG